MTRTMRALLVVSVVTAASACASTPRGPSVMVLPGASKRFEDFQADDGRCRQFAATQVEATKGGDVGAQQRYDMAYTQCMYSAGNQIPVNRSQGFGGTAAGVPPPPAGTPPAPPPPAPSR
jgi:hypothetical protein